MRARPHVLTDVQAVRAAYPPASKGQEPRGVPLMKLGECIGALLPAAGHGVHQIRIRPVRGVGYRPMMHEARTEIKGAAKLGVPTDEEGVSSGKKTCESE